MPQIEEEFTIEQEGQFDCSFEIFANETVWGAIEGDIENQTDLKDILDSKADDTEITELDGRLDTIEGTLPNLVPNTRTVNGKALSANITLNYSDVGAMSSTTTINDLTTTAQQNALNSGATTTNIGQIATNTNDISTINGKIPTQASTTNQLADKSFVNSSISTNTANFIGTFNSVADLEAYSGTVTNNDYAFVVSTDSAGNTVYNRYKWNGTSWLFEYALNNSSFTSNQWASINSGITSNDVTLIGTALQPNDNITKLNNNAGYTSNIGTVTKVNNTSPDANGNVSISIPPAQVQADWDEEDTSSKAYIQNKPYIPSGVVIDQVFDGTSENGQSGKAILPVLHSSKGYTESGQVYSDTQLYNDILAQYTNSFDISKFTVVGTPTITTDGIASGFSSSNYLTISTDKTLSKLTYFKFSFKFTTPSSWTKNGRFFGKDFNLYLGHTATGVISGIFLGSSLNTTGLSALDNSSDYIANYIYDSTGFYVQYKKVTDETYTTTTPVSVTSDNTKTLIGYVGNQGDNTGNYFTGSIDLKQFSITVNGQEVFSGHKTGTDTYYTDNYTVVGSPTIADGIASGFSGSNYITSSTYKNNLGNADTWSIEFYGVTPDSFSSGGGYQGFFGSTTSNRAPSLQSVVESGSSGTLGKIRLLLSSNNSTWNIADTKSTDTFAVDTLIGVRLEFTGTQYLLYTKIPNGDWKLQITVNSSIKVYNSNELFQLGNLASSGANYWRGGIKLNSIRIIENDVLVYSSDLSIPYTISIGSKIADAQYRPDVLGAYYKYGADSGRYYTIDTTNQNATLPCGDVYSLIATSMLNNFKLIQGYDGTATQTLKHVSGVLQWVTDV